MRHVTTPLRTESVLAGPAGLVTVGAALLLVIVR